MINLLIAVSNQLDQIQLAETLATEKDIRIVASFRNEKEILSHLKEHKEVTVILLDARMASKENMEQWKDVLEKETDHRPAFILRGHLADENVIAQAFAAGVSGYILKEASQDELLFAIRQVASGNQFLGLKPTMNLVERSVKAYERSLKVRKNTDFSPREIDIIQLMAEGLTNKEMAEKLFISKRTIEGHRQNLIDKTGVKNTASLIRYAVLNEIIQ